MTPRYEWHQAGPCLWVVLDRWVSEGKGDGKLFRVADHAHSESVAKAKCRTMNSGQPLTVIAPVEAEVA